MTQSCQYEYYADHQVCLVETLWWTLTLNLLLGGSLIFSSASSGVFLGCKIRGADFCSLQKFSLTMQKFLKPISWTFQKLWISNVVWKNEFWQRWQKFLGCKNFFSSCKSFCMMLQKSLFAAQKDRASGVHQLVSLHCKYLHMNYDF